MSIALVYIYAIPLPGAYSKYIYMPDIGNPSTLTSLKMEMVSSDLVMKNNMLKSRSQQSLPNQSLRVLLLISSFYFIRQPHNWCHSARVLKKLFSFFPLLVYFLSYL